MRRAFALVLAVILLAACTKAPTQQETATTTTPSTEQPPAAPTSSQPSSLTTIRVLTLSDDPVMDALISAYQAKYPTDRIQKVRAQRGSREITIPDLVKEMVQKGEMDLLTVYNTPTLVQEGLLLPLDPLLQQAGVDLSAYGDGLDALRYEGKLYQLPYSLSPNLVLYNPQLFADAGVDLPKAGWTWEQFRETAQKLTKGEGQGKTWGVALDFPDSFLSHYLNGRGSGQAEGFANEALMKEALGLISTLVQTDGSMVKVERWSNGEPPSLTGNGLFRDGRAAMTIDSFTTIAFDREMEGAWKIKLAAAPMPVQPVDKPVAGATGQSISIAANAQNVEAAWRFARFVGGPDGAEILARMGRLPLYNTPEVKKAWAEQPGGPLPGTEFLLETTWYLIPQTWPSISPGWTNLFATVRDVQNAVMSGAESWEDGFARYKVALQQYQSEQKGE